MSLTDQDVAARGNFCTVDAQGIITDRRAGRISTEECARMVGLIEDITLPGVELIVKPVRDYRFALILRGPGLSLHLNETDPQRTGHKPLVVEPQEDSAEAKHTAELVNQWVAKVRERIKSEHPANMVTLRGWSKEPGLPSMESVFKLKAAALAVYPMYKGLASLAGMTLVEGLATFDDQLRALKSEWDAFDFFFVHYKYTDSRGEDGNFDAKVKEIEKVDKGIPQILELNPDVLVVTGDHSTPAVLKSHSWHPVPVPSVGAGSHAGQPGCDRLRREPMSEGRSRALQGSGTHGPYYGLCPKTDEVRGIAGFRETQHFPQSTARQIRFPGLSAQGTKKGLSMECFSARGTLCEGDVHRARSRETVIADVSESAE